MAETTLPLPLIRDLFLCKEVSQGSIEVITKSIIEINHDDERLKRIYEIYGFEYHPKPINLYIDSYGGEIYPCYGLLSVIDKSKTPVYTIATGAAMSAGFIILISGHRRFAYSGATPMYHQVGGGAFGVAKDIAETSEEMQRIMFIMHDIVLRKTKISKKKLDKIYSTKKDWFMSASDALKFGVVDEII